MLNKEIVVLIVNVIFEISYSIVSVFVDKVKLHLLSAFNLSLRFNLLDFSLVKIILY